MFCSELFAGYRFIRRIMLSFLWTTGQECFLHADVSKSTKRLGKKLQTLTQFARLPFYVFSSKRKLTKRAPLPLFPCCSSRKKTYMYNVANVQIGSRETKSGSFPNNFLTIFSKLLIDFWGANTMGWSYMKPTHAVQTKKIVRHR